MKNANTSMVVALLFLFASQISTAQQVKRQYQDDAFAETTVVIKEEAASSDMDILNENFDMDDVGMGQVFRITTETDRKTPEMAALEEAPVAHLPAPVEATPTPVVNQAPPQVQVQQVQVQQVAEPAPTLASNSNRVNRSSVSSGSTSNRTRVKRSKSKRVKLAKRKSKKQKGNRCYRF